jgi:hypothetical protein
MSSYRLNWDRSTSRPEKSLVNRPMIRFGLDVYSGTGIGFDNDIDIESG